jgi:hypothetical protein
MGKPQIWPGTLPPALGSDVARRGLHRRFTRIVVSAIVVRAGFKWYEAGFPLVVRMDVRTAVTQRARDR